MAGFLGINKKVAGGAAKPTAPVKPAIKPIAKPVVKPAVGAIKPPTVPAGKPVIKPVVKAPVEPAQETEVKEEAITLAPTPVEEAVETTAPVVEATVETKETTTETTQETKEEVVAEKVVETVEEVKEEVQEEVKEETKATSSTDEYTEEELAAMSPQKRAAITRKKNQENKKRKEALEQHKAELASASTYQKEEVPARCEMPYEEVLSTVIISSAGESWDEQVAQLTAELKSITIEPDMNTATMKHAMSDLVALKDTIFSEYTLSKTILEATERKIDMVKGLNAKGSSADERKLNSLKACVSHTEGGYTINLYELLDVATAKFNFYNELMKQIEFKSRSLITMNGALKLEKDALGQL